MPKFYLNPIFSSDFADPTIIYTRGEYYAYATETFFGDEQVNIQVAKSADLITWEYLGDALPQRPLWATKCQDFWAPHVIEHGNRYIMYYSASKDNTDKIKCLAVAIAKTPDGPFVDIGESLSCGDRGFEIDPCYIDDKINHKSYLSWGSGNRIVLQELDECKLKFKEGSRSIEIFRLKNNEDHKIVEGSFIIYRNGYYFLFAAYGDYTCDYSTIVLRSRSIYGPYERMDQNMTPILSANDKWIAPGQNCIIQDKSGNDWIVYHAIAKNKPYIPGKEGGKEVNRMMLMDKVEYVSNWPTIMTSSPSTSWNTAPAV